MSKRSIRRNRQLNHDSQVRLVDVIGWLRRFFLFDPAKTTCVVCKYRLALELKDKRMRRVVAELKKLPLCANCALANQKDK